MSSKKKKFPNEVPQWYVSANSNGTSNIVKSPSGGSQYIAPWYTLYPATESSSWFEFHLKVAPWLMDITSRDMTNGNKANEMQILYRYFMS